MRRSIVQLLLILTLPFAAAVAQERVVVTSDAAKVFKAPGFDGVSTPVARGTQLTVLERKGDWVRIYDGKAEGFVHIHAGIAGGGDLDPAATDWNNPVALVHIERIR